MIQPSKRWRFVKEIEDRGYCEDEIVIHHLTEHRAMRRSFSEKFSKDETVKEQVKRQMIEAARCRPPALPLVYAIEEVHDRLTIICELVTGIPVKDLVNEGKLSKQKKWLKFAYQLLTELIHLREADARFERLPIEHLVVTENDEIRINQRQSIGRVSQDIISQNALIQRFQLGKHGGVYTSSEGPDEEAEMLALRDILLKAGSGNVNNSYEKLRQMVLDNPKMYSSSLGEVDSRVAEIIVRISGESVGGKDPIRTLQQARNAVSSLRTEIQREQEKKRQDFFESKKNPPPQDIAPSGLYNAPKGSQPISKAAQVDFGAEDSSISGMGAKSTSDKRSKTDTSGLYNAEEKASTSSGATKGSSIQIKKQSSTDVPGLSEDFNPFATDDQISQEVTKSKSENKKASTSQSSGVRKKGGSSLGGTIKWVIFTVVILAVIGGGGFAAMMLLNSSKPNEKPVARISETERETVTMNEKVELDASDSIDPDGNELDYTWKLISPGDGSVIFSDAGSSRLSGKSIYATESPKINVQFQTLGPNVLELTVYDGLLKSEAVTIKFEVERP